MLKCYSSPKLKMWNLKKGRIVMVRVKKLHKGNLLKNYLLKKFGHPCFTALGNFCHSDRTA